MAANEMMESVEMRKFFRALAAAQTNSIYYLMSAKNEEEMKKRATSVTKKLIEVANRGDKCPPGQIRNQNTGECEPILLES